MPRIRRAGKFAVNDLAIGKDPIIDPRHTILAESLIDLTCNIAEKLLEPATKAPEPNPFDGMTDQEIMAELARRTGREILMMPGAGSKT